MTVVQKNLFVEVMRKERMNFHPPRDDVIFGHILLFPHCRAVSMKNTPLKMPNSPHHPRDN